MLRAMGTKPYQDRFIDLLAENEVIRFGEFTLKSGRKSPYFINAGQLRTGRAIAGVGRAYAERLREAGLSPDVIFGPSYKGVPLRRDGDRGFGRRDVGSASIERKRRTTVRRSLRGDAAVARAEPGRRRRRHHLGSLDRAVGGSLRGPLT
jgi:hypothetical protein